MEYVVRLITGTLISAWVKLRWLAGQRLARVAGLLLLLGLGFSLTTSKPEVLTSYLLLSLPTHSVLMIPHEPVVLATVQILRRSMDVKEAALLVSVLGTLGAGIAAILDQVVLRWAFQRERAQEFIGRTEVQRSLRWFKIWPFFTVVFFAATLMPFAMVRWIAAATEYSIGRYTAAVMVGRAPRIFLLAMLGGWWVIPSWAVWLIVMTFVVILVWLNIRYARKTASSATSSD